jgi:cystathionine gamma-lyase/cystathionine beta-lyase
MKFSTKAVHAGYEPDAEIGSIMPPIYMTSTFMLDAPGETRSGYDYTRAGNPNFTILEKTLAALEEAQYATVFSSGLGALTAMISTLSKGDHVLALEGLYGGTYRLFKSVFVRFGIELEIIKLTNYDDLDAALGKKPKWLLFETPTNPILNCVDIEACVQVAKKHGVLTVVDNTFATPYFQNPLRYGVDIVWHSTTKYIGGHSDVIGGVVLTNSSSIKHEMDFLRKSIGTNPSPLDTWLITRGVKTLALRMERHAENAMKVAKFLENHPKVNKVYYPGLTSHSSHEIAHKQMSGFGGMVSAEFNLTMELMKELSSSFSLFALAESLGGVESLVCHPATMTHASIPVEERHKIGISDGLLRFSVGVEDSEDLIDDLFKALERVK